MKKPSVTPFQAALLLKSALLATVVMPTMLSAAELPPLKGKSLVIKTRAVKPDVEGYDPKACFPIREIRINGIEIVDIEAIRKKVEPIAASCLDNALASAVVKAVNDVHADNGFVTTQGFLPDQDIRKDKRLTVNVYPVVSTRSSIPSRTLTRACRSVTGGATAGRKFPKPREAGVSSVLFPTGSTPLMTLWMISSFSMPKAFPA